MLALSNELERIAPTQLVYSEESLHITAECFTESQHSLSDLAIAQFNTAQTVCKEVVLMSRPVQCQIKGICVVGNQIIAQVFPENNHWEQLRFALEAKAIELLLRFTEQNRETPLGEITLNTLELLTTDQSISTKNTTVIERVSFNSYHR